MGHVERIIQDIKEELADRALAAEEAAEFGTGSERAARIAAEVAEYGEEITLPCAACRKQRHIVDLLACQECGLLVCATCPADCNHGLTDAEYQDALLRAIEGDG